jgi:plasmid stabilization system protein ParE
MKVRFRDRALADLSEISSYLAQRNPAASRNVIEAIHNAVRDIAQFPMSARRTDDHSVRVKVVSRYRYKIFYSVGVGEVEILHVRHGSRRSWYPERKD